MPLFKFVTEFYGRASNLDEAEQEAAERMGQDVYEKHVICKEVKDEGQDAEFNLLSV